MIQLDEPSGSRDLAVASANCADDYETFLSRLTAGGRRQVERHLDACESETSRGHAVLWKRLACALANLAPRAVETSGRSALRYFISDGAYRLQVFAMEDLCDRTLIV